MNSRTLHPQWLVPDWDAPPHVRAFCTTRAGGTSTGPWGTVGDADGKGGMNVGLGSGEARETVLANRARLRALLPSEPRWLRQVHGANVVDADGAFGPDEGADASVATRPGTVCVVQVADCLPVLVADAQGRAVGAAHAGWRGLASGVIQRTVDALRARLGDPAARVLAWLGPAIGPDAFEVGPEVLDAMRATLPDAERAFVPHGAGKYRADLFALARQALDAVGVADVHGGGLCTWSDPLRFYSHRRDRGVTGRHAAFIWIDVGDRT